jgi:serine/threonine protein kinase
VFQKFGKFVLLEKIATGGMAEIWLAKQSGIKGFEKLVVIKKILSHLNKNEKFTKMFINEAKIASKLNHPNIVQIYDLGKEVDSFYIVMEYIQGYDLLTIVKKSIKAQKRLPLSYAVKIIANAANALYYANTLRDIDTSKLNIVHRDISPQNILVSYDGITKLVDFGIAKAASSDNMTKTGVLKGKYPYMSPEQIMGKALDGRSDIFSLAIVLYEITVGKRLFKANSELMVLKKIKVGS